MRVFVCAPLKEYTDVNGTVHTLENNKADAETFYAEYVRTAGFTPFVPHRLADILDDSDPEEQLLGRTLALAALPYCQEVWVFGDYVSEGMRKETDRAWELGIRVILVPAETIQTFKNKVRTAIDAATKRSPGCVK
jgi:hypothetical protein